MQVRNYRFFTLSFSKKHPLTLFSFFSFFTILSLNVPQVFGADKSFTLNEAVEESLKRNPGFLKLIEKEQAGTYDTRNRYAYIMPTIQSTLQYDYRKDAAKSGALFGGDPYSFYTLGVQLRQPIFQAGAAFAGIRASGHDQNILKIERQMGERNLTLNVIKAFYGILLQETKVQILKDRETNQKEFLKMGQTRLANGLEDRLNILQMKTQLALLTPKIQQAENERKVLATELSTLMGMQDTPSLSVSGSLPVLDWKPLEEKFKGLSAAPLEFERVQEMRSQFEEMRTVEMSRHFPSLAAVGGIQSSSTVKNKILDSDARSWTIGLQLQIPLFTGLTFWNDRAALASKASQLEKDEVQTRNELSLALIKAKYNLELFQKIIESAETALKLAEESEEEARKKYRLGIASYQQLFQTLDDLQESRLALAQARSDAVNAMAQYFSAAGLSLQSFVTMLK